MIALASWKRVRRRWAVDWRLGASTLIQHVYGRVNGPDHSFRIWGRRG
jgi:hypothetical protein